MDSPDFDDELWTRYCDDIEDLSSEEQQPPDEEEDLEYCTDVLVLGGDVQIPAVLSVSETATTSLPLCPVHHDAVALSVPAAKRPRFLRKTSCGLTAEDVFVETAPQPQQVPSQLHLSPEVTRKILDKLRYFYMMKGWKQKYGNRPMASLTSEEIGKVFASLKRDVYWTKVQNEEVASDMSLFMDDILDNGWPAEGRRHLEKAIVQVQRVAAWGLILTANGSWGVLSVEHVKYNPSGDIKSQIDLVVQSIKKQALLEELFRDWEAAVFEWLGKTYLEHCNFSLSMELCVKTFMTLNIVRVHLHAYVDSRGVKMVSIPNNPHFRQGAVVVQMAQIDKRNRKSALNNGHYYLQFPKIGSVYTKTNHQCHESFAVKADWINDQWRQKNITDFDAIAEHVRCGQNSKFHVENIQFCARHRDQARLQELVIQTDAVLNTQLQIPTIPAEVAEWRAQYSCVLPRYKILILHGESRTGKSMFVHWYIPGILEINCSGGLLCPDLKDYDEQLPGIFFDEACLKMICFQKKLMQGINKPVKLGQTNTGMYSYEVYTHRKMMVVANNTFVKDYQKLDDDDKAWIDENSIALHIKRGDFYKPTTL